MSPPFLPRAVATWITPELIERTRRVWQPYYSQPLTSADAIEILENTARLIAALGQSSMAQSVPRETPDEAQKKRRNRMRKRRAAKA